MNQQKKQWGAIIVMIALFAMLAIGEHKLVTKAIIAKRAIITIIAPHGFVC